MPPASSHFDQEMMRRTIQLARQGRGAVEPNPMVGCVIVRDGHILGQGYHQLFGGPHAEPNALAACKTSPHGATAYVTLEPCCHTNKKTPPCVPALIQAGIARVVVGCVDPNPAVSGKGLDQLRSVGIQAESGILENEACQLNAAWFAKAVCHRPYVTLKWAQSADNKIAGAHGRPVSISNATSQRVIHQLRSRCDAILVGINTVLTDNPLLTVRHVPQSRTLARIVLDRELRIPLATRLITIADQGPLVLYCSDNALESKLEKVAWLRQHRITVLPLPLDSAGHLSLPHLLSSLNDLPKQNPALPPITHLLIEPGPTLAKSFIEQNLADRVWLIQSPALINDPTAPAAYPLTYPPTAQINLDGDLLTEHLNPTSPAFYAALPSADFPADYPSLADSGL